MNIPGNSLGRFGLAGLTLAGIGCFMVGITRYGGMLNITTRGEQILAFVLGMSGSGVHSLSACTVRYVKEKYHRRQAQQINALPGEEGRVALTPPAYHRG
jgi:type VI secretion system protein ImpL